MKLYTYYSLTITNETSQSILQMMCCYFCECICHYWIVSWNSAIQNIQTMCLMNSQISLMKNLYRLSIIRYRDFVFNKLVNKSLRIKIIDWSAEIIQFERLRTLIKKKKTGITFANVFKYFRFNCINYIG